MIWYREPDVEWVAYHDVPVDENDARLAALGADGYQPVHLSVVSPGDRPQVSVCLRRGDGGDGTAATVATARRRG